MLRPKELLGVPVGAPRVKGRVPPAQQEKGLSQEAGEPVGMAREGWRAPGRVLGRASLEED